MKRHPTAAPAPVQMSLPFEDTAELQRSNAVEFCSHCARAVRRPCRGAPDPLCRPVVLALRRKR